MRPAAAVLGLVVAALLPGCASDSTAITTSPVCRTSGGPAGHGVILMAQSVPTATSVPCINSALPLGWTFHHMIARNGIAQFWLDSDRDGTQAIEVRLTASCDTRGTTEIPSDREGMRRLERVGRTTPTYQGTRYYLFDGGCLAVLFSLAGGDPGEALALASQVVGVVSRSELRQQVHDQSGGRLQLDPEKATS
jgi:hypothetical protein